MKTLLLINGPNLGNLGTRKTDIYGTTRLETITQCVEKAVNKYDYHLEAFQSNHEGELIDFLNEFRDSHGAIVNPGALMMYGWSLRDALEDYPAPWIEVHISNIFAREAFRHKSILSPISSGIICGFGVHGYILAALNLLNRAEHEY